MAPKRTRPRVPSNEQRPNPNMPPRTRSPHDPRNMVDPQRLRRGGRDEAHRLALLISWRDEVAQRNPPEELEPTWFAWHHGYTGPPPAAFDGNGNFTPAAIRAMNKPGHSENPRNWQAPASAPGRSAPPPPPPPPARRRQDGQASASSGQTAPGSAVVAAPSPAADADAAALLRPTACSKLIGNMLYYGHQAG